jgi:dihydrofolate reductase
MALVRYGTISSLDGYVADADGEFAWAAPDEQVHAFVNDLERPVGTYWYGRRMYEVMSAWQTMDVAGEPDVIADYADIWRAADKVVFSRSLSDVSTPRTELRRVVDMASVRSELHELDGLVSVGGSTFAGSLLAAGLVDEVHHLVVPVIVGGGTAAFPRGLSAQLALEDQRWFPNGTVYHRYRVDRR